MDDEVYALLLMIVAPIATPILSYLIGSIPWAYIIVRSVSHEDISEHGTGNVGAMNVRRTTGSWGWFVVAMVADAAKGFAPTLAAKMVVSGFSPDWGVVLRPWADTLRPFIREGAGFSDWPFIAALCVPMLAVLGAVLGHNYSLWLAIKNGRFARTGKGLATGGGALLAYDWRYFVIGAIVGLLTIAITRYMMAGQVAGAMSIPAFAIVTRQADWPFALILGLVVYAAHHNRFVGMLRGQEPKLYTGDRMGPRG